MRESQARVAVVAQSLRALAQTVPELPRTSIGKVLKRELRRLEESSGS